MKFRKLASVLLALLLLVTCIPMPANAVVQELFREGDWGFGRDDQTFQWVITSYYGYATEVTIPTTLRGMRMTSIFEHAFDGNRTVKTVWVPENMRVMGFWGDHVIENIHLGEGVKLNDKAFSNCSTLKTVTLPSSLEGIPYRCFENCVSLTDITLPAGLTSISSFAFLGCTSLRSINIPESVIAMGSCVFGDCSSLTSISVDPSNPLLTLDSSGNLCTRPDSDGKVTLVRAVATDFGAQYQIPDGIHVLFNGAYSGLSQLRKVIIPDTVTRIENEAFGNCPNLTEVHILSRERIHIGQYAFMDCVVTLYVPGDTGAWDTLDSSHFLYSDVTVARYCTGIHKGPIGTVIEEATCTKTGLADNICELCGEHYEYVIPLQEHTYESAVTKEPECAVPGERTYTCTVCGDSYPETIPSHGHDYDWENPELVSPPTCSAVGKQVFYCKDCDKWTESAVTILPHTLENGVCTVCGARPCEYGHSWDTGVVTKEPTLTETGIRIRSCFVCGAQQPEDIPVLDFSSVVSRIYGNNRYETAFKVAEVVRSQISGGKFQNIIVASGTGFADALSGSFLADLASAPILLVKDQNTMNQVKEYIRANLVPGGTVYLLGGTAAVPAAMETGLEGFTVKRLGGANRYETNLLILQEAERIAPWVQGNGVLVCTGNDFADSLSASAVGRAILLVKDDLTSEQKAYLQNNTSVKHIIGGTKAVSQRVENSLKEFGVVKRIGGATRYETSVLVAKEFYRGNTFVLAYAGNFPDGLSGSALAHQFYGPLILTASGKESIAAEYAKERFATTGFVLGGPTLINDKAVREIFSMEDSDTIYTP